MGYSISVKFKNENQKHKSIDFIKENKEIINKIVSTPLTGGIRLPYFNAESFSEDEDIPYGPKGKNLIGWKETGISKGLYSFVLWLAHKNGQSFYYYDDEKSKFTVRESFDENLRETQVNSKGFLFKEEIIMDKGFFIKFIQYLAEEEKNYSSLLEHMNILENNWNEKFKPAVKIKIR